MKTKHIVWPNCVLNSRARINGHDKLSLRALVLPAGRQNEGEAICELLVRAACPEPGDCFSRLQRLRNDGRGIAPAGLLAMTYETISRPWALISVLAVFLMLLVPTAYAENTPDGPAESIAEVRAYTDRSVITIGEKVKYVIEVDSADDAEISFPSYSASLGGFAVRDFGQEDLKKIGRRRVRRKNWYLLDTYTVGPYVIPPQEVNIKLSSGSREVLKSPEIFVEVKSVIKDAEGKEEEGLRDIKSAVNIQRKWPVVLLTALALIGLGITGALGWYFIRKRFQAKPAAPPLPPHEIAFQELNRIDGLDLIRARQISEYYYLISICLRTYLENRFGLRAPEQTTEEFLESVVRGGTLEGRFINMLKEYMERSDLVKFARLEPPADEIAKVMEVTRRFIDETKPAEAAPAAEGEWEEDIEEATA